MVEKDYSHHFRIVVSVALARRIYGKMFPPIKNIQNKKETRLSVSLRSSRIQDSQNEVKLNNEEKKAARAKARQDKLDALRPPDFNSLTKAERLSRAVEARMSDSTLTTNRVSDIWNVGHNLLDR